RLACAGGAHDEAQLALLHGDVDVAQRGRGRPGVGDGHRVEADHRCSSVTAGTASSAAAASAPRGTPGHASGSGWAGAPAVTTIPAATAPHSATTVSRLRHGTGRYRVRRTRREARAAAPPPTTVASARTGAPSQRGTVASSSP